MSDARASQRASLAHAHFLFRRRDYLAAQTVCRRIISLAPADADATHLLGLILKELGAAAEAERQLRRSLELDPARADFHANLANLLRRQQRHAEAIVHYRTALAIYPGHHAAHHALARTFCDMGRHTDAEPLCRTLLGQKPDHAQVWITLGVALRGQGRLAEAESAYRRAIALEPGDAIAHHNLGALLSHDERAEEAIEELEYARRAGLAGFELAFNRGRALLQLGRIEEAEHCFAQAVAFRPTDALAQTNLARLRYMRGDPAFARDITAAAKASRDKHLQMHFAEIMRLTGDPRGAVALLSELLCSSGRDPVIGSALAAVLHDLGDLPEAEMHAASALAEAPEHPTVAATCAAIWLALARFEDALALVRRARVRWPFEQQWIAYECCAHRRLNPARYAELYDYDRFVRCYDLGAPPGWASMTELLGALRTVLSQRHRFAVHPFDQSLRHGSQTPRSLLTDPDPAIRSLLQAFAAPVDDYLAALGRDPKHPLRSRNDGRAALASCWSVRLGRGGFHVNHIHPQGWISSACYIDVPREASDADERSGWLKLGEPHFGIPGATPEMFIQPRPGRLVLFPSYMWHGTTPIHGAQPRTTVAFDLVPAGAP